MASNADVVRRVVDLLRSRPEVRRRARSGGPVGISARPNAPRMVTILVAIGLTLVGLTVTDTVVIGPIQDLLTNADLSLTDEQGWLALLASPVLLVIGSFFRGI